MTIASTDVQDARRKLKLTQRQFAAMIGVHHLTVSCWERGVRDLPPYNEQQVVCIRRGLRKMSAEDRETVVTMVERGKCVEALAYVVRGGAV